MWLTGVQPKSHYLGKTRKQQVMRVVLDTHVIVSGLSLSGNERLVLEPAT